MLYGGNPSSLGKYVVVPRKQIMDYAQAEFAMMEHMLAMEDTYLRIGLWEFQVRVRPSQGRSEVVNAWHFHFQDKHLAVLGEPEITSGNCYLPVKGRHTGIDFWVKGTEAKRQGASVYKATEAPTGCNRGPNPWRCPKCGSKPPDGGLMMAMLNGAPL